MISITKQEKDILVSFIETKIPEFVKSETMNGLDLMECYEELFNYTHGLLEKKKIDFSLNSYGSGKNFIVTQEYISALASLVNSDDVEVCVHCCLSLTVLSILRKYLNK